MDETTLYERVWELSSRSHDVEGARVIVGLVDRSWPEIDDRAPCAEDAETCRLTMLAASTLDSPETSLWRVRALERFRAVGWMEAVGLMQVSAAYGQLARENDFYPRGKTLDEVRPSTAALRLLQEAEPFLRAEPSGHALKEGSPTAARLRRQYPEKLGFLLAIAGEFDGARASYKSALAEADDDRGVLRCRLALSLLDYLERGDGPSAAAATAGLATVARGLGDAAADISETAEHNVRIMRDGGSAVLSYERL